MTIIDGDVSEIFRQMKGMEITLDKEEISQEGQLEDLNQTFHYLMTEMERCAQALRELNAYIRTIN